VESLIFSVALVVSLVSVVAPFSLSAPVLLSVISSVCLSAYSASAFEQLRRISVVQHLLVRLIDMMLPASTAALIAVSATLRVCIPVFLEVYIVSIPAIPAPVLASEEDREPQEPSRVAVVQSLSLSRSVGVTLPVSHSISVASLPEVRISLRGIHSCGIQLTPAQKKYSQALEKERGKTSSHM
jgi:hypothetical protein